MNPNPQLEYPRCQCPKCTVKRAALADPLDPTVPAWRLSEYGAVIDDLADAAYAIPVRQARRLPIQTLDDFMEQSDRSNWLYEPLAFVVGPDEADAMLLRMDRDLADRLPTHLSPALLYRVRPVVADAALALLCAPHATSSRAALAVAETLERCRRARSLWRVVAPVADVARHVASSEVRRA